MNNVKHSPEHYQYAESWLRGRGFPLLHCDKWREVAKNASPKWREDCFKVYAILCRGGTIALLGDRGTGKTQMAVNLAIRHVRDQYIDGKLAADRNRNPCRYTLATDMFRSIRDSFRKDGPRELDTVGIYTGAELLVLDEIHVRGHTPHEDQILIEILDKRYFNKRATLLIGNIRKEELAAQLGPSIARRIDETGGIKIVSKEFQL